MAPTVFARTVLTDRDLEVQMSRDLLRGFLANRAYLLAAVLAGPSAWRTHCARLFRGTRLTDTEFDSMYRWLVQRAGRHPEQEFERVMARREAKANQEAAEAAYLKELDALAHGKNREEEEAKMLKRTAEASLERLPEIVRA